MVELVIRLGAALVLGAVSFGGDVPPFSFAWKLALSISVIAVFVWRLEEHGFRNSGVAGFIAAADALCIALFLTAVGVLDQFGFTILVPVAYAATRYGSPPASMVPLAAGSLFVAHGFMAETNIPPTSLFVHAAGILVLGLLLAPVNGYALKQTASDTAVPAARDGNLLTDAYFELRETYRSLRESYQNLETKGRREHLIARISEIKPDHSKYFDRVANKLKEILEVPSVAILTLANMECALVVRAANGVLAHSLQSKVLPVDLKAGHTRILNDAELAVRAVAGEDNLTSSVLILDGSRVMGVLCLAATSQEMLEQARETAGEIAPILANFLLQAVDRETGERRLREAELLYEAASLTLGAENPETVAKRVTRDMKGSLDLDHLGVFGLEDGEPIYLSAEGSKADLLSFIKFPNGEGLEGWLASGAPETILFNAYTDRRCLEKGATKARVGSYTLMPLGHGEQPIGFLTAATHRAGGIDEPAIESLRIVAAELGQALERVSGVSTTGPEGCMTPQEFAGHISQYKHGQLITLEPLRMEGMIQRFGRPAATLALRRFAKRMRSRLPVGGAITARSEGGFVAYVPFKRTEQAASWANELIAMASMIEVRTPDGSSKIPFPMRSRVAELSKQQDEVLGKISG